MAGRANAASELTRFWLQTCHNCLVDESLNVTVPYGNSDIDLVAMRANLEQFTLPNGATVGPRLIIEVKDEHDFDPSGKDFGQRLTKDVQIMGPWQAIPEGTKDVKFSMLRQEHYSVATTFFGTQDFDRLFVVHAMGPQYLAAVSDTLARHRIYWLTLPEVVAGLVNWYQAHPHGTELRNSLIGDLLHLLVGFCHLTLQSSAS